MKTYYLLICILASIFLTNAQTFTASFGTAIPADGTSAEFELIVSGLPAVIDTASFGLETVCLNIQNSIGFYLHVRLVAPDGSSCLLFSNDGYSSNFTNTCFSQSADEYIFNATYPYTGTWKPEGDLGSLNNGQDPNGSWKIIVYDRLISDAASMESWSISFGNSPAKSFPFHASNLPILKINTGGHWIVNDTKMAADFYVIDNGPGELNYPEDTDYYYIGQVSVKLQGYSSVNFSKKSYDIDLLDDAGNEIDTVLLGLPSENDFIIRADHAEATFMKNELAYELMRRSGNYAPRTRYCELILDGEYQGLYSFQEKVDRDVQRMDVEKLNAWDTSGTELTGGYIFESNIDYGNWGTGDWISDYASAGFCYDVEFDMIYPKSDSIQPVQLNYIHAYTDSFENALYSDDFLDSLIGYRKFVSAKSFVDVMLINELMGNLEGYERNIHFSKEKITDGGQLKIGPQTDFDHSAYEAYVHNWTYADLYHCPMPFWWGKLVTDPEFLMERYCRYNFLRDSIWEAHVFENWVDSVQLLIGDAVQRNYNRWARLADIVFEDEVNGLLDYFEDRLVWLDETINNDSIAPPDAGFSFTELSPAHFVFTPLQSLADYNWDFGDGSFSSEQNPEHIYTESGTYVVTLNVNYHYGCSALYTDTITAVAAAIQDQPATQIKIYPNPANDELYAEFQNNTDLTIELSDVRGRKYAVSYTILENKIKIDVSALTAGIYFLNMRNNTSNFIEKVLIEK